MTLLEIMVAMTIGLLIVGTVVALSLYTGRSFASIAHYL